MVSPGLLIANHKIRVGHLAFVIAEMPGNHNQSLLSVVR